MELCISDYKNKGRKLKKISCPFYFKDWRIYAHVCI